VNSHIEVNSIASLFQMRNSTIYCWNTANVGVKYQSINSHLWISCYIYF